VYWNLKEAFSESDLPCRVDMWWAIMLFRLGFAQLLLWGNEVIYRKNAVSSAWQEVKLGDVCESISQTFRRQQNEVVLINTSDVLDGKVTNHKYVPNENLRGQFKKLFKRDDILYSEIRPKNRRFAYVDFDADDYVASTKLMVIRSNGKILPSFLFHVLKSDKIINQLQLLAETRSGTFPQITFSELAALDVDIPSIKEQREIAATLQVLDDKIENNKTINHRLEQAAQAIFKNWFVDFEPWGGVMPNGWQEGAFKEIISSTLGGDWGKDSPVGNNTQEVYCIRGADIPDVNIGNKGKMPIRFIPPKNYNAKQLAVGDIVVEISGGSPTQSTGRCALITQSLLDRYDKGMVCTNFCRAIKPLEGYSSFIYFYWKYLYDQNVMFSYENGTTGIKNLDILGFLENELITMPKADVVAQFAETVEIFIDVIFANGLENESLANTRDTLLPRLMSGKLSVADLGRNKR